MWAAFWGGRRVRSIARAGCARCSTSAPGWHRMSLCLLAPGHPGGGVSRRPSIRGGVESVPSRPGSARRSLRAGPKHSCTARGPPASPRDRLGTGRVARRANAREPLRIGVVAIAGSSRWKVCGAIFREALERIRGTWNGRPLLLGELIGGGRGRLFVEVRRQPIPGDPRGNPSARPRGVPPRFRRIPARGASSIACWRARARSAWRRAWRASASRLRGPASSRMRSPGARWWMSPTSWSRSGTGSPRAGRGRDGGDGLAGPLPWAAAGLGSRWRPREGLLRALAGARSIIRGERCPARRLLARLQIVFRCCSMPGSSGGTCPSSRACAGVFAHLLLPN